MESDNIKSFLSKASKDSKKDWRKIIAEDNTNKKWVDYSSAIAMRLAAAIEDSDVLSQTYIAGKLNVTTQQINKIMKGKQNLTLKTISEISEVIGVELISFPDYKDTYNIIGYDELLKNKPHLKYSALAPTRDTVNTSTFYTPNGDAEYEKTA